VALGAGGVFTAGFVLDTLAPSAPPRPIVRAPARAGTAIVGLPEGAELTIDGTAHPERRVFLPPGRPHRVRVQAQGFVPFENTLISTTNGTWVFSLAPTTPGTTPAALAAAPPTPDAPTASDAGTTLTPAASDGGAAPAPAASTDGGAAEPEPDDGHHRRRHRRRHDD
jgi:hypothetical protein